MTNTSKNKRGSNKIWVAPVVLIAIIAIGAGAYYAYNVYEQQQLAAESSALESSELAELEAMRRIIDQDVFYSGITIDGIDVAGKTYDEVKTELETRDREWREQFVITLTLDDEPYTLTSENLTMTSDWQSVLDEAWQIGRTSELTGEAEQIRERYAIVTGLQTSPRELDIVREYDESALTSAILALADTFETEPVNATAVGFDLESKLFTLTESVPGRIVNGSVYAAEVLKALAAGDTKPVIEMIPEEKPPAIGAAEMQARLGLVSEASTIAVNDANRNTNIRLVCEALNGHVVQPCETFSYNQSVGKRTVEKGYKDAGTIVDGVLKPSLGGGICQPSTTLFQAVMKADLEIALRYPHSWPSSYTKPGLDATVTWGGADFKFVNDTEYPVAIVCSFVKQKVLFKIYGRNLDDGVTIDLDYEVTESIPVTADPTERYNPELKPGERKTVRHEYTGLRVTTYKVWKKDGTIIENEVVCKSYYKPLNEIIEYGPPVVIVPTEPTTIEETTIVETTPVETTVPETTTVSGEG